MAATERIVTIDGPAGAGKSTLAKALAKSLGWTYLDTGAMYRAVGLAVAETGADVRDEAALGAVAAAIELDIVPGPDTTKILLNGKDVTTEIRQPHISRLASDASKCQSVRNRMMEIQRHFGRRGKIVAEGRDMGTVVFPDAAVKIYLIADPSERACRRQLELVAQGHAADLADVAEDMRQRDENDSTRTIAPLKPAADAYVLDSTSKNLSMVLQEALLVVRKKIEESSNI